MSGHTVGDRTIAISSGTEPWFHSALRRLSLMLRAAMTRPSLTEMDERMLRDIGINRADALREAARAPWDTHMVRANRL